MSSQTRASRVIRVPRMSLLRLILFVLVAYGVLRFVRALLLKAPTRPQEPAVPHEHHPTFKSPHDVLGVRPGASQRDIRAAYQKLVMQYHPDRVSSMGPDLVALAEQRIKEINAAYEALQHPSESSGDL